MEPSPQPPTGPVTPEPPIAAPARRPKRRWVRAVLLTFAGVALLLCLGGVGIGFLLYDRATEPDRTTPDVAADSYLRALLVDRDEARANVFACQNNEGLDAVRGFANEIKQRENLLQVTIAVNLEDMRVDEVEETAATVSVTIRRTAEIDGGQQSPSDRWRLVLREEGGWRVCGAEKIS